jgi:hypothetical protein
MKKLSLLFVASVLAVGSAYACGGGDEPAKNPNDVASASASTATPAASSADATPSATAPVTASATASAPPPAPEAPPLAIEGIKIAGKNKDGKPVSVEVKADGSVSGMKDGKVMVIGQFAKNEIRDDKGTTIFAVAADGKVTSPALAGGTMQFNDKDELLVDGKPAILIGDDGTPTLVNNGKSEKAPFKFEKLPPKSKRAAVVLVAMMLMARATAAAPPPAVSVGPAASVPPKASASAAPKAK